MNAKKIMGAVLVALLAAALFVGAGAAGSLFFYQDYTSAGVTAGTYTYAGDDGKTGQFTIGNGMNYVADTTLPTGKYENETGDSVIMLSFPTYAVSAQLLDADGATVSASIAGATLPSGKDTVVKFNVSNVSAAGLIFTNPNGAKTYYFGNQTSGVGFSYMTDAIIANFTGVVQGEWKVQALINKTSGPLVSGAPANLYYGADILTFTVGPEGFTATAASDAVTVGDTVAITFTGTPGPVTLDLGEEAFVPVAGQPAVSGNTVTIPNIGTVTVYLIAKEDGSQTIKATKDGKTVSVSFTVAEGELTAEADKESYFLGSKVILSGINTGGNPLYFYIEGTNFPYAPFTGINADINGNEWEVEIEGYVFTNAKLDAGTYTIYVTTDGANIAKDNLENYATASVALKQPFLTAEAEANIIAKGETLKITGIAESAANVTYYVFGTNFFKTGVANVDATDSSYTIKVDTKGQMDAGQYFVVVQHPMYDKVYEIAPFPYGAVVNATLTGDDKISAEKNLTASIASLGYNIVLNSAAAAEVTDALTPIGSTGLNVTTVNAPNSVLFNTKDRQSSNAAEALCQALDDQNIDDIYVKLSFMVASPMATMDPIASEVVKGEKLTVSGTSNYPAGEPVTVQMASTAFGAIPKESVNSASFIAITTKVQEDGTWEVTFDTTGLNVDEYTIQATVGEFQNAAKVNVVEGAPVTPEQPDTPVTPEQPEQPEQPTEPETPGFGALAALAGLGAVAVLLLRRE